MSQGLLCITRHTGRGKNQDRIVLEVPPSTEPQTIEVVLIHTRGSQARIGIQADRKIIVSRKEVHSPERSESMRARLQGEENGTKEI